MDREKKKLNIRQRVFRLVLSAGVLTFLALGIISIIGIVSVRYDLYKKSGMLKEYSSEYIQEVIVDRQKSALAAVAHSMSQNIEQALREQMQDVQYLSDAMTVKLQKPTLGIDAQNLVNGNEQRIPRNTGYIFYVPELREEISRNGMSPTLAEEIRRAGNIVDFFIPFGHRYEEYYTSFQAASKNGYFICMETRYDGSDVSFDDDFLENYDFRVRPWYLKGMTADKPVFTDVYIDTDENPSLACVMSYYDAQGDFAGVISIAYGIEEIYKIVLETAVGEGGFSFILNSSGNVILSAKKDGIFSAQAVDVDLRNTEDPAIADAAKKMVAGEEGVTKITYENEEYYLAYAPMPASGWSFATLMSNKTVLGPALAARDEVVETLEDYRAGISKLFLHLFIIAVVLFALLLAWLFVGSSRVSKRFVEPIQKLSEGVKEISAGNLEKKINVDTGDELEDLARNINIMTDEIKNYMANLEKVTAAEERIATELKVATNIQLNALPHDFLEGNDKFEIFATMKPAKEVGGDFYDFYLLDENHLMLTIADVSGKGVPAALFMMRGKTILKNLAMTMQSPDDLAAVMTLANNQLCQGNDEMMFITVFLAMLDLKTGKLIYVNGGHNPPMVYHENEKKFSWLKMEENCVIGLMDEMFFEQQEIYINPKDILYLYTDGVTEAMNKNREQYGENRLENCLNNLDHNCKLPTLLEGVSKSLAEHVQDAEQSDDITMLAVRFN